MKKGFTMIELIFVIVILGILASVAIPRLAATREDAEISAAVANLRTLISDASAYYTVKGSFPTGTKWNQITNVPLVNTAGAAIDAANAVATTAPNATAPYLKVGGKGCIGVHLVDKKGNVPAYIKLTKNNTNQNIGVCAKVLNAEPVKAYINSKVPDGSSTGIQNAIAIGSNTKIY